MHGNNLDLVFLNFHCFSGKTRTRDKYRIVYTDHQRYELEHEFNKSKYITIPRKAALSSTLGLSERQVNEKKNFIDSYRCLFVCFRLKFGFKIVVPKNESWTRSDMIFVRDNWIIRLTLIHQVKVILKVRPIIQTTSDSIYICLDFLFKRH